MAKSIALTNQGKDIVKTTITSNLFVACTKLKKNILIKRVRRGDSHDYFYS